MPEGPRFVDDHLLQIGSYEFHCEHPIGRVPDGRLPVEKPRRLVEDYLALCTGEAPARIVEIGVYKGGSTVMISELVGPEKLVAIELTETPVAVLDGYIAARGLEAVIRPHYGVDQSDRARVGEIMATEFAGAPIDLVIDDASHLYDESVASFETVFPRVRPGGLFVLEDWRWQHQIADAGRRSEPSEETKRAIARRMEDVAAGRVQKTPPMSRMVVELFLARASSGDAVSELTIGPNWVSVRRGPAALDPATFRIADLFHDHFDLLTPRP